MSASNGAMKELDELLQRVCDSTMDDAAFARLAEILASSKTAQRRYIECIDLCVGIAHAMPGIEDNDRLLPFQRVAVILPVGDPHCPPSLPSDATAYSRANVNGAARSRLSQATSMQWIAPIAPAVRALVRLPWFAPAAAVLLLCCLSVLWVLPSFLPHAAQPEPAAAPAAAVTHVTSDFAARIVAMTKGATWDSPNAKVDALFRIAANETIHVAAGLVKLEFFSGATIILRAPAIFTPTGSDSGRLDRGRLTGMAAKGNFRLMTKAAEVIDLGTEFGVAVDDVTGTDVLVFDGEVQVVSRATGAAASEVLTMTNGMAARIHHDGTKEHDFHTHADAFSRSLAQPPDGEGNDELSLVDVICGGNGFDNNLAGAIDPLTGLPDSGVWHHDRRAGRRQGNGMFHATSHRPPLDGVFVPAMSGVRVQIDSLGNTIELPPNIGQTYGPIWARRWTRILDSTDDTLDFWGTGTLKKVNAHLQTSRHGLIGLHPNVGFTIDLQAARMQQHCGINGFVTALANLDSAAEWVSTPIDTSHNNADFRVFVDGVLRYSRLSFRRSEGPIDVFVPLSALDQKLTLVSSEGEGEIRFDDVVLIDPVLKLDNPTGRDASE
jgi:hypothetical protein